jgi:fibronectin type 3 domain-containing protein
MYKLNRTMDTIDFCTYINGMRRVVLETRYPVSCVGPDGNIYFAGGTDCVDFPVSVRAYQRDLEGESDGFIMKFDPTGSTLLESTLIGGPGLDLVKGMAIQSNGSVVVVGTTLSTKFPVTPDALKKTPDMGGSGFISVMASNLSVLEYSTCFGGFGYTQCNGVEVSSEHDRIYVQGGTSADDLPVTDGCLSPLYGSHGDFFLAVLDMSTHELLYCTYVGGDGIENYSFNGLSIDDHGNIRLVGATSSSDFPLTENAYSKRSNGKREAFVLILDPEPLGVPSPPMEFSVEPGDGFVNMSWDPPSFNQGQIIQHRIYKGTTIENLRPFRKVELGRYNFTDVEVTNGIEYLYAVSAINSAGEGDINTPRVARPFGLPSPPTGLNATTGDGTVVLNWTSPRDTGGLDVLGYHVHRARLGYELEPYRVLANVSIFSDTEVVRGEAYTYAVATYTSAGISTLTPLLNITAEGTPDPPRSFSLDADDRRIVLSWSAPIDDGGRPILGYRILRGTRPDDLTLLTEVGPAETEYIDGGLENGQVYYYRMRAINVHGLGHDTSILPGVPEGLPGPPRDLRSIPSNGKVTLTWSLPDSDGGSTITSYRIYVGTARNKLSLFTELEPITSFTDTGLTNGVTRYYALSAVNGKGEGVRSIAIETTPYGTPGPPTDVAPENDPTGVYLTWRRPVDKGGAANLTYRVMRGSTPVDLVPLDDIHGTTWYLDTDVTARETYYYAVRSVNPIGDASDMSPSASIKAVLGPGAPINVSVRRGDGLAFLTWSPPGDDGGASVIGYVIYRGPTEVDMAEIVRPGEVLSYSDRSLENGRTYFYSVAAINTIGLGMRSHPVNTTPISAPGAPRDLTVRYTGDGVDLEWLPPNPGGTAPVTGYRIYRRTEGATVELLMELGKELRYTDRTVEQGRTYTYSVAATSDVGEGPWGASRDVSTGASSLWPWLLLALVVLGALAFVGATMVRRRAAAPGDAGTLAGATEGPSGPPNIVEEVYLVYGDGRLIATCSREECKTQDADLTSSMLIAIQGMVQEGIEKGGELESIKSGDNIVMMERGVHLNLAVVVYGRPDDELKEELESTVALIEGTYAGMVEDWSGDRSVFDGVDEILEGLLESTAHLTREDLDAAMARYQVSLLSAIDLYRGYVRLKVAAMNATPDSVSDASIEVRYDPAMLRLERVEPDSLHLHGDSVDLGNVKTGEKRTVSFLFDPLICQETYIDGTVSYRDARGELMRTSMKRRHAKVVCPIFFTREHASTATLLRLISDELEKTDSRVFRYPSDMEPRDALQVGKLAQGGGQVQLVREFEDAGPPFEAEAWYYGETKVKGYKIVMRLRVLEEDRLIEFFAASSAMEPVTGLLAEFRRDLLDVFKERYRVEAVEEVARTEEARMVLSERELLIRE